MRVLPRKIILADASNHTVTETQFLKKYPIISLKQTEMALFHRLWLRNLKLA
jgi:hypothetical protein